MNIVLYFLANNGASSYLFTLFIICWFGDPEMLFYKKIVFIYISDQFHQTQTYQNIQGMDFDHFLFYAIFFLLNSFYPFYSLILNFIPWSLILSPFIYFIPFIHFYLFSSLNIHFLIFNSFYTFYSLILDFIPFYSFYYFLFLCFYFIKYSFPIF